MGPGLAAEAGIEHVFERQIVAIEDLIAMKIGEWHFRSRNQKRIPVAGDLEKIGLELRELAGRFEGCSIHEIRGRDFEIAMLTRLKVEHKVGQRP